MDGNDHKQIDPPLPPTGSFGFHFKQHFSIFKRMMLSGPCFFQISFSLMVSEATSSKKTSMISFRENYLFIPLPSHM